MTRDQVFSRLLKTRGEFEAARYCLTQVQERIRAGEALLLAKGVTNSDIRLCAANLEATYSLRLFTEFEFILRDFWIFLHPSSARTNPTINRLIDRIAARCRIPSPILQRTHKVREIRNEIIHVAKLTGLLTFEDCKSRLGKYLSYLPPDWN